ncbi:hypothetical protein L6164_012847 [Bauhinia variegata]|uniref:Uncharacterized protein n=1 Tax=Bauhinia variegata TaxID=167791 RepID=A0ACB9PAA9_BAUVA|nr:hypothetical protein L6164_012847 [Bauhinia variegata]
MASASSIDLLPQPTLSLDPFSLTNDQIMKKVVETHIPGEEKYDVVSLFNVAENIIKHSTQTADTYLLEGTTEPIDLANDKPFPENLSLPLSKIKHIGYEMTSKPARDKDHAHQTTMAILYELERSHWGAKVAITLAAFAMEYGNFWHLAQIQSTTAALGKSLALLNGGFVVNRLQGIETQKPDLTELNNLVKTVLKVTEYIIELKKLSSVGYDQRELPELFNAIQEIPVDVYWLIIIIAVCATHVAFHLGDSEYKPELSEFDEKLHSILTNLTEHVTEIRKKIDDAASQKISLLSPGTNIINPFTYLGQRKNIFYYGKIGIDLTDKLTAQVPPSGIVPLLDRKAFPDDFIFGTATSAYQIEGAVEGRGYSTWDRFTHKYPRKIKDGSNGDIACDALRHIEEDIKLMKDMNTKAYRFSISWPRIIPNRPQALEKEYDGFLSCSMVDDFKDFAKVCFERFGDRVKHWITLNEPFVYCYTGYVMGIFPPGRCSNPDKDPYVVAHNLLLAHAAAVLVYRNDYKSSQGGEIGITLDSPWTIPYSKNHLDEEAAKRALDFILGWFMDPLTKGEYPKSMQNRVKKRLPKFSESDKVQGSFDFIGINYYTTKFAAHRYPLNHEAPGYDRDTGVVLTLEMADLNVNSISGPLSKMNAQSEKIDPKTDLELGLNYSSQCIQKILNNDSSAGANATSRLDNTTFVASGPLSELVWSADKGLSLKCADSSFAKNPSHFWDVGPTRQMGFEDANEVLFLCKLANEYLKESKGCEELIYEYCAHEKDGDSLYMKMIQEFEICTLSYLAFHWKKASFIISQALSIESEKKTRLKEFLLAAAR